MSKNSLHEIFFQTFSIFLQNFSKFFLLFSKSFFAFFQKFFKIVSIFLIFSKIFSKKFSNFFKKFFFKIFLFFSKIFWFFLFLLKFTNFVIVNFFWILRKINLLLVSVMYAFSAVVLWTGVDDFPVAKVHGTVSVPRGELRDSGWRTGPYCRLGGPGVHEEWVVGADWREGHRGGASANGDDHPGHGVGPVDATPARLDRPRREYFVNRMKFWSTMYKLIHSIHNWFGFLSPSSIVGLILWLID